MACASPAPKRELGLRDVTLFAIAVVTSARWIAPVAQHGRGSFVLWLITSLVFEVPWRGRLQFWSISTRMAAAFMCGHAPTSGHGTDFLRSGPIGWELPFGFPARQCSIWELDCIRWARRWENSAKPIVPSGGFHRGHLGCAGSQSEGK